MLPRTTRLSIRTALLAFLSLLVIGAPAQAVFPGANGKFVVAAGDLYTFNPDGSDLTNISNTGGTLQVRQPSWSPDGRKIAFAVKTPVSRPGRRSSSSTPTARA